MSGVARVGDKVSGTAHGQYRYWYDDGKNVDNGHYEDEGYFDEDLVWHPVLVWKPKWQWESDWKWSSWIAESVSFEVTLDNGSSNVTANGKKCVKQGDRVTLTASFTDSHGYTTVEHQFNPLTEQGTVAGGSGSVNVNGSALAYNGCTITTSANFSNVKIVEGSSSVNV